MAFHTGGNTLQGIPRYGAREYGARLEDFAVFHVELKCLINEGTWE